MIAVRRLYLVTIAGILGVLVLSGPVVDVVDLTPAARDDANVGSGSADVTVTGDPAADIRIDRGRFGTGVYYLRPPAFGVSVADVAGRSRLVYIVRVPALDYEGSTSDRLGPGAAGDRTLQLSSRAFERDRITEDSYRAELVVRVQSFEGDRVVYHRNVTVRVHR